MKNDNDIDVIVEDEDKTQYNADGRSRDDSDDEDFVEDSIEDDSQEEDERLYSDPDDDDDEEDDKDRAEPEETEDAAIAALRQQINDNELRLRKSDLASAKNELIGLENRYDYLVSEARKTQQVKAEAISSQQGEIVIAAEEYLQKVINEALQIERAHKIAKETLDREENDILNGGVSTSHRQTEDDLSRTKQYAKRFQEEIGWNDLPIKTKRRIENLDNKLAAEGFSTSHPRYWQILKSRARKAGYLSDYDNQGATSMRKGGPATASSNNNSDRNQREQVYISKERKEALIAAGVWDDPHLRSRYVKRYQEWDRENKET